MRPDAHRLSPTSQIGLYPGENIASYTETTTNGNTICKRAETAARRRQCNCHSHGPSATASILYDTYDTVFLTCSKKLTDSQLSLPHGINKKCKRKKTKNKLMSLISPVQSHDHEDSPMGKEIRWEGFVEKIGFELGVKSEGVMDDESGEAMMTEMG